MITCNFSNYLLSDKIINMSLFLKLVKDKEIDNLWEIIKKSEL